MHRRTVALIAGSLLLCAAGVHANGLVAMSASLTLAFEGAVVGGGLVVLIEGIAYWRLLGAGRPSPWLTALLTNIAAVPPMAAALFLMALARWEGTHHDGPRFALASVVCLAAVLLVKTGGMLALYRTSHSTRLVGRVALGVSAVTAALIMGYAWVRYTSLGL